MKHSFKCLSIIIVFNSITVLRSKNFAIHILDYKTEVYRCWITHPRLYYNKCWNQNLNFSKFDSENTLSNIILYLNCLTVPKNIFKYTELFGLYLSYGKGNITKSIFKIQNKSWASGLKRVTQARTKVGVIKPDL